MLLFDFVKEQHGSQARKYTGEPYWTHCLSVAEKSEKHVQGTFEVAICHDLLEDTKCKEVDLQKFLLSIEYSQGLTRAICNGVIELTDQYTKEACPDLKRSTRKELESRRLGNTYMEIQSIKCADLIDNTKSIVEHDPGFAKVYLKEKKQLLGELRKAQIDLYIECCHTYYEAIKKLEAYEHT